MQHQFEILTDSTCDIPLDELAELKVEMVPLHVFVAGGSYHDMVDITSEQFYDKMASTDELPHSSQPSPTAFLDAYNKMADDGAPTVLSIHIATALSGTANSAEIAAKDAKVPVHVWDSRTATVVLGMMVKEACRMRDAGESLESTVAHLDELSGKSTLVFVPDTLENIVKNGRCSRAKGLMSSLLNIKAVLSIQPDGSLEPVGKGRGTERALESLAKVVEGRHGKGAELTATLLTVRNQAGVDEMVKILEKHGFVLHVMGTCNAGPVIATHTGAGLIGLGCIPTSALYA